MNIFYLPLDDLQPPLPLLFLLPFPDPSFFGVPFGIIFIPFCYLYSIINIFINFGSGGGIRTLDHKDMSLVS